MYCKMLETEFQTILLFKPVYDSFGHFGCLKPVYVKTVYTGLYCGIYRPLSETAGPDFWKCKINRYWYLVPTGNDFKYSAGAVKLIMQCSPKHSQLTPHSSPVRMRYAVSFLSWNWCSEITVWDISIVLEHVIMALDSVKIHKCSKNYQQLFWSSQTHHIPWLYWAYLG